MQVQAAGGTWRDNTQTASAVAELSLSLVRFNVPLDTTGHFGAESSQAINYTGTDNKKITN